VAEVLRRLKSVMQPVHIGYAQPGQILIGEIVEAADVHPVHLAHGGVIAHPERPDATDLAEIVLILMGVERVPGQLILAGQDAETAIDRDGRPEPGSATDGTIAPVRALREIQVSLELQGSAMTTARICFEHRYAVSLAV
jgi:hypothetical protein